MVPSLTGLFFHFSLSCKMDHDIKIKWDKVLKFGEVIECLSLNYNRANY